jgi:ABC-type uncharacterized transport system substrate-binding protein
VISMATGTEVIRMRRREFIALFAAAVASRPVITLGQGSAQRPLIAVLSGVSQAAHQYLRNALQQGLQELGYVEGRDYDIEYRYADGDLTREPALVDELIRHRPNVIVTPNVPAALAAKQATISIPIVVGGAAESRRPWSGSEPRPPKGECHRNIRRLR